MSTHGRRNVKVLGLNKTSAACFAGADKAHTAPRSYFSSGGGVSSDCRFRLFHAMRLRQVQDSKIWRREVLSKSNSEKLDLANQTAKHPDINLLVPRTLNNCLRCT